MTISFMIGIMAQVAQWEWEQISKRTKAALMVARARGTALGGDRGNFPRDPFREPLRARRRASSWQSSNRRRSGAMWLKHGLRVTDRFVSSPAFLTRRHQDEPRETLNSSSRDEG
jgi:DNA invertase Pin-like site-specific DNA recombinase